MITRNSAVTDSSPLGLRQPRVPAKPLGPWVQMIRQFHKNRFGRRGAELGERAPLIYCHFWSANLQACPEKKNICDV